ncbi:MAG: hypothetical protein QCH31_09915 [Methanolobus sp.]|nr:hypothetical protein [Methanolobus sp.]
MRERPCEDVITNGVAAIVTMDTARKVWYRPSSSSPYCLPKLERMNENSPTWDSVSPVHVSSVKPTIRL